MSRRNAAEKREIAPDYKFGSVSVSRFINKMMWDGKKSVAEKIFYDSMMIVAERIKKAPLEIFDSVITSIRPMREVRSRRMGGATYQIPFAVSEERGETLAMRALIDAARSRKSEHNSLRDRKSQGFNPSNMAKKLAEEMIAVLNGTGSAALKRKEDMHKVADANKAFSHFK